MNDPTDLLRAVVVFDPAIDRVLTDVPRYAETRDPSLIHALPGRTPCWVVLRPLSVAEFALADSKPTGATKVLAAFRSSCIAIENHRGRETISPTRTIPNAHGPDTTVWDDDAITMITSVYGARFWIEIGQLAYERAVEGNGWGGCANYTLPPSSQHALDQIAHRLAVLEAETAGIAGSSKRSPNASTPRPPPSSAAGTSAPATEATDTPSAAG